SGGVLWLSGPGGIGKSYLLAALADGYLGNDEHWCAIVWRFRAGDGDRCHRFAFFRHAVTRLARWPRLGRPDVVPAADPSALLPQLADLLEQAVRLTPADPRGRPPRVLFVLDGLDEIARQDPDFAEVPFRLDRPNVVWLCAGRPEGELPRV